MARWASAAVALGFLMAGVACHSSPSEPTKLTPTPSAKSPLQITGTVKDPLGRPLEGVTVLIALPNRSDLVARTTADGRFTLSDSTPVDQRVSLQLSRDGYLPATSTAPNTSGHDIGFSLIPANLLSLYGVYKVTVTAASSCIELPPLARTRTYMATIRPNPTYRPGILLTLNNAEMVPFYDEFSGIVADDAASFAFYSWDAYSAWLEDHPIIERVEGNASVALAGKAITTAPVKSNGSLPTTFDGTISYCAAAKEPATLNFPLECASAPIECASSQHHVLFTRQ